MKLTVLTKTEKPIYEQLYDQIVSQILNKEIKADTCLPSIRAVARDLGISIITVKNAYEKLEAEKFIYTVPGKGCFVGDLGEKHGDVKLALAEEKIKNDAEFYKSLGLSAEEIYSIMKKYV